MTALQLSANENSQSDPRSVPKMQLRIPQWGQPFKPLATAVDKASDSPYTPLIQGQGH